MKKLILILFLLGPFVYAQSQEKNENEKIALDYFKNNTEKIINSEIFQEQLHKKLMQEVERIKKTSVVDLTKELLEKEEKLKKEERELSKRENQLKNSEEYFASRIKEFEKTQRAILGCLDENKKNEALRIGKMVKVLSNMKPDKAAELLSTQDSNISVKLLAQLDPMQASKIFNKMDKETSARLQKQYLNMKK